VINGAMQVSQRSTSETGQNSVDGYVALDRWKIQTTSSGTFTISQSTEAPDGFANSLKIDCTAADTSPAYFLFLQRFEGQNLQHIQKGKTGAKQTTVSFYVRSSKTGTYQVNLLDSNNNRLVGSSYTISSADTWEYKSVTFAADTTGEFNNDNGYSMQIEWWLAAGSTYTGGAVPTAWEARVNTDRAAALNVAIGADINDDFYVTGVQLEVGEKATPFEHRSYGDELQRCERYFQQWKGDGTPSTQNVISGASAIHATASACFLVPSPKMRGPFDIDFENLIISDSATYDEDVTAMGLTNPSGDGAYVTATHGSNGVRADAQSLRVKSGTAGYLQLDAEL